AISAILAAVLIPRFTGFSDSARETAPISDGRNIPLAVEALQAQGEETIDGEAINDCIGKIYFTLDDDDGGHCSAFTVETGTAPNITKFTFESTQNEKIYNVTVDVETGKIEADLAQ
ncbi:MAG: hypothetical protein GX111_02680, partial [Clostridiales bacterium]|nr:hypothetical protein [Clostridiales bacterium]